MAREKTERTDDAASAAHRATLSVAELRQLITLMNGSDIAELGIEEPASGLRLSLRKPTPQAPLGLTAEDDQFDVYVTDTLAPEAVSTLVEVTSPRVGAFRLSMKPGDKPLIAEGDIIREGQVICAIEALKVPNEVEAPIAGRIQAIYLADGEGVEYGQPLLAIEPQG
ncbi:MAG TPA: acetyl-CoA carboxylase biotin carboxyl carrier protein subunit [Ktedonobacterales bacterium]